MLHVENLSVTLSNTCIVENVSFHVARGEFLALIGPNGSGKSTILKALSRIHRHYSGSVRVDGRDLGEYRFRDYSRIVSSLSQHNGTIDGLMVREMVAYGRIPHKRLFQINGRRDAEIIDNAIAEVDLAGFEERQVSSLSGGELQRVHLAASFAQEPELLLLDEPTNHLDVRHQYNILKLVKQRVCSENLAALCVLHDINQAIHFADRIAMLKNGRIRYLGLPSGVVNEESVRDVFEINTAIHPGNSGPLVEFLAG